MGETQKAFDRRVREKFFDKYISGHGLDIGAGTDPLTWDCETWDLYQTNFTQDAHDVKFPDETFDWVYSSHCLEHLDDPRAALREQWRLLKRGGFLILFLPHRDLYEKRERPPSRWNSEHKNFFVPDRHLHSDVLGVRQLLEEELGGQIQYVAECSEGHTISDPDVHSDGEISIEAVVRK